MAKKHSPSSRSPPSGSSVRKAQWLWAKAPRTKCRSRRNRKPSGLTPSARAGIAAVERLACVRRHVHVIFLACGAGRWMLFMWQTRCCCSWSPSWRLSSIRACGHGTLGVPRGVAVILMYYRVPVVSRLPDGLTNSDRRYTTAANRPLLTPRWTSSSPDPHVHSAVRLGCSERAAHGAVQVALANL